MRIFTIEFYCESFLCSSGSLNRVRCDIIACSAMLALTVGKQCTVLSIKMTLLECCYKSL